MSGFCMSENVDELKAAAKDKTLFKKTVKTATLLMVFEILWNIRKGKKKCKECFSQKTFRGMKKFKGLIKKLLKKKTDIEKRKKLFLKAPSSFRKVIRRILSEFIKNCTVKQD